MTGVADLVRDMRTAGITTSAVVLDGADRASVSTIVDLGEGRHYTVDALESLSTVLAKEATEAQRRVDDDLVRVRAAKPGDKIAGAFRHVPPLHGYVSTRPKPATETILVSHDGDPILARWCRGAGTVAAWTSDLEGPWSVDWLAWDGYKEFWRETVFNTRRSECRRDRRAL
jgi:uncharacterized membrane protein